MRRKIGEICEIVSGTTPKTGRPEYWGGECKWITPAELNDDSYFIYDTERKLTQLGVAEAGLHAFPAGTVLLSSRAPIGKVAIAGAAMTCNQGFKNLICTQSVHNRFLYWFLKSQKNYLISLGRGATFKEISKAILADVEMELPSLDKQIEIADQFESITSLIMNRRAQIVKLDELIKARFVEMFGGCHDTIRLGDVFHTLSGGTPSASRPEYYLNGKIPWLTSGEINQGIIAKVSKCITEEGLSNSSAKWIPINSIVIAMYGATAGKVGLLKIRSTSNQAVCAVLPHASYHPYFLYYAITSQEQWMLSRVAGAAQPNLSQIIIRDMQIVAPPVHAQAAFAAFVEQVDKSKVVVQLSQKRIDVLHLLW